MISGYAGFELTLDILKESRRLITSKLPPSILPSPRDMLVVIDGAEGAGKSSFADLLGSRVDETYHTKARYAYSVKDLSSKIVAGYDYAQRHDLNKLMDWSNPATLRPGSWVVLDEGSESLYSRSWQSPERKELNQMLMTCRFRGLMLCVCLTDFEVLESFVRMFRAAMLLRVEAFYDSDDMVYGIFSAYSGKQLAGIRANLKQGGSLKYPHASYMGVFPKNDNPEWQAYGSSEVPRKMELMFSHHQNIMRPPIKGRKKKGGDTDEQESL